jgi:hypothetical protein
MEDLLAVDKGKGTDFESRISAESLADGDSAMFAVLQSESVILKRPDARKPRLMGQGCGFHSLSMTYPLLPSSTQLMISRRSTQIFLKAKLALGFEPHCIPWHR